MKSILLPLTAQTSDEHLTSAAALLASQFRATLNGLFVRPDPRSAIPFMGEGLTADMIQDLCDATDKEGKEQASRAMARFKKQMDEFSIGFMESPDQYAPSKQDRAQARWRVESGEVTDHVGRKARTADLAICSKPSTEKSDSQEIFHDLIYRSGRPVLMVPDRKCETLGRHIMVAWNGRAEGARAVGAALPLLWAADKVTLLQIGTADPDRPGLSDLADYLGDHSIECLSKCIEDDNSPVGAQILAASHAEKADMIVLGAYSHSRWREMILGGATRHLVSHSDVPIFMSH